MPLVYAALPQRGAAFLIDAACLAPLFWAPWQAWPVAATLWFAGFEASPWQATPGKRLLGLRVMEATGRRTGPARAWMRAMLKMGPALLPAPYAAPFYAAAVAGILFHRRRRAWYDLLAGTSVIRPPRGSTV
jgi:uncharacterized RDD family membrane protein YckC